MHRLFVAIPLPNSAVDELLGLEDNIRGARWMSADNMHITLSFIGNVSESQLNLISEALEQVCFSEFTLVLKGVDYFGTPNGPRILWSGVEESRELRKLQKKICSLLKLENILLPRKRFVPHITIARLSKVNFEDIGNYLELNSLFKGEKFIVNRFALYSSKLTDEGSEYSIIQQYYLDFVGET